MHSLSEQGAYMVTCGTYRKVPILDTPEKLTLVRTFLFEQAGQYGWQLQAWAIMANHYHFVAISPDNPETLKEMVAALHKWTAMQLNRIDKVKGRQDIPQFFHCLLPLCFGDANVPMAQHTRSEAGGTTAMERSGMAI